VCDKTISINSQSVELTNTTVPVTIPKDFGPSGGRYSIHAQLFQTDGRTYRGEMASAEFKLESGTGSWGKAALAGYTLWSSDGISCTAFACVQACSDIYFHPDSSASSGPYQECASACPGVDIDWSSKPISNSTAASACPRLKASVTPTSGIAATATTSAILSTPTSDATSSFRFQLTSVADCALLMLALHH